MKIALYARVSSPRQAQTQSIEQQLERLQAYCQSQQWSAQDIRQFRDEGYSGAKLKRPGLDRLRDAVAHGEVERLLITAPDRLARNYVHQSLLLQEFESIGCQVVFLDHPMSQDPHDQLLLQIRGAVAEYERTLIAERMRRGRQQKLRAGAMLPCAKPPYGYRSDPDHPRDPQRLRVEETEAAQVVCIFTAYLQEGQTLAGLARHLTQLAIPTPSGRHLWNPSSLRQILTNPTYTGNLYANRERSVPARRRRSPLEPLGRGTSALLTVPEEWLLVCQVPALVSQEQFDQVQAKLRCNATFASRNNTAHAYLLRQRVSCGLCQGSCSGVTRGTHSYYLCRGKLQPVQSRHEQRCRSRFIPVEQLDALVWQDLCHLLQQPALIEQALQRAQAGAWLPQELQARRQSLSKAISSLNAQLERLTEAYLAAVFSLEEYRHRRHDLEQRVAALDQQQRLLEGQVQQQMEVIALCTSITDFCQRVSSGLEQATFEQKRQLVELLIDRVIVTMEEVEIHYVIPTSSRSEHLSFYHLRTAYFVTKVLRLAAAGAALAGDGRHGHSLA